MREKNQLIRFNLLGTEPFPKCYWKDHHRPGLLNIYHGLRIKVVTSWCKTSGAIQPTLASRHLVAVRNVLVDLSWKWLKTNYSQHIRIYQALLPLPWQP